MGFSLIMTNFVNENLQSDDKIDEEKYSQDLRDPLK